MISRGGYCDEVKEELNDRKYQGCETVLLVDDQIDIVKLLDSVLTDCGYRVISAFDGQHAVDTFKKNLDSIDIIVMDIIMPHKDGIKAYYEMISLKPDIKIIFMSGFTDDSFGEFSKGIELIQKPFSTFAVIKKIREKLDQTNQ